MGGPGPHIKFGGKTYHKTQKLGKNPNFGVKSQIQRAKFGVLVTYIFRGKIWGPSKNFRGKFWGQAPKLLIWKYPLWASISLYQFSKFPSGLNINY